MCFVLNCKFLWWQPIKYIVECIDYTLIFSNACLCIFCRYVSIKPTYTFCIQKLPVNIRDLIVCLLGFSIYCKLKQACVGFRSKWKTAVMYTNGPYHFVEGNLQNLSKWFTGYLQNLSKWFTGYLQNLSKWFTEYLQGIYRI